MAKGRSWGEAEHSLSIRAAWLHYVGGLRQAKVAKLLGVPSVKAHRLIAWSVAKGETGDNEICLDLSLKECEPDNRQVVEQIAESVVFWASHINSGVRDLAR
ncbi:MAG: hypothetical protein EA386_05830 [Rhodobacteraceae bacterium]|nr:MAG: hypothetical protein EA386_05830 [Paracoccaceae bacterium]